VKILLWIIAWLVFFLSANINQISSNAVAANKIVGEATLARNAEEVAKGSISAQSTKQINQGADELAKLASNIKSVLNNFEI
jgi:hypothetical protein